MLSMPSTVSNLACCTTISIARPINCAPAEGEEIRDRFEIGRDASAKGKVYPLPAGFAAVSANIFSWDRWRRECAPPFVSMHGSILKPPFGDTISQLSKETRSEGYAAKEKHGSNSQKAAKRHGIHTSQIVSFCSLDLRTSTSNSTRIRC